MRKVLRQRAREQCLGQTFGSLTILGYAERPFRWKTQCRCGKITEPKWANVATGITTSCGCRGHQTHGLSSIPTYHAWQTMFQRCQNPMNHKWKRYGGRGIRVCERWQQFENFFSDMGIRPIGTSLDRVNNDGNYEPSNCRWATRIQQQNNTRLNKWIVWNGQRHTFAEWARQRNLNPQAVRRRLEAGWTLDRTMTTPVKSYSRR